MNDALGIVTGCLRPTPMDHLPILSGIQPAKFCRLGATFSLAYRRSLDPDRILYGLFSGSSDVCQEILRSRRPFVPAAQNLLNLAGRGIRASQRINYRWNAEYCKNNIQAPCFHIHDRCQAGWNALAPNSLGQDQPPASCFWPIPFVLAQMGSRSCTESRVQRHCTNHRPRPNNVPIFRAPHRASSLTVLSDETRCWLNTITANF